VTAGANAVARSAAGEAMSVISSRARSSARMGIAESSGSSSKSLMTTGGSVGFADPDGRVGSIT
jgi:hypothetical protein